MAVSIEDSPNSTTTDLTGEYETGTPHQGMYDVTFSKLGYFAKTVSGVSFSSGMTTMLDVELVPIPTLSLTGQVLDGTTSNGVENAQVKIIGEHLEYVAITDAGGNFSIANVLQGSYDVVAGKWGYVTELMASNDLIAPSGDVSITINEGYYDDFSLDFDWTTTGSTGAGGAWVRQDPVGTELGAPFLLNPEDDVEYDLGLECYVTGNSATFDFVGGGSVLLISPEFDVESYEAPYIDFSVWFANIDSAFSASNGLLKVTLNDGTNNYILDSLTTANATMFEWDRKKYRINDFTEPSAEMKVLFEASNPVFFELLEVGIDAFMVMDSTTSSIENIDITHVQSVISPNPVNDVAVLKTDGNLAAFSGTDVSLVITDLTGKVVIQQQNIDLHSNITLSTKSLAEGMFIYQLANDGGVISTGKFIVQHD